MGFNPFPCPWAIEGRRKGLTKKQKGEIEMDKTAYMVIEQEDGERVALSLNTLKLSHLFDYLVKYNAVSITIGEFDGEKGKWEKQYTVADIVMD
jgi:hypothetical protein